MLFLKKYLLKTLRKFHEEYHRGVMVKAIDCGMVVSEFEHQLC